MSREHGRRFCLAMAILLSVLAVMFFLAWSRQRKRIEPKPPLHIEGITSCRFVPTLTRLAVGVWRACRRS